MGEGSIPVHKVIIAARNQVFYKMFTSAMKESNSNSIPFDPKYTLLIVKVVYFYILTHTVFSSILVYWKIDYLSRYSFRSNSNRK